ncbi:hypothetical protein COJ59_21600 [Bacillus cereus]|nr:hypothetical protein COJ59_21600 [Bacillus cereus]
MFGFHFKPRIRNLDSFLLSTIERINEFINLKGEGAITHRVEVKKIENNFTRNFLEDICILKKMLMIPIITSVLSNSFLHKKQEMLFVAQDLAHQ